MHLILKPWFLSSLKVVSSYEKILGYSLVSKFISKFGFLGFDLV